MYQTFTTLAELEAAHPNSISPSERGAFEHRGVVLRPYQAAAFHQASGNYQAAQQPAATPQAAAPAPVAPVVKPPPPARPAAPQTPSKPKTPQPSPQKPSTPVEPSTAALYQSILQLEAKMKQTAIPQASTDNGAVIELLQELVRRQSSHDEVTWARATLTGMGISIEADERAAARALDAKMLMSRYNANVAIDAQLAVLRRGL